MLKQVVISLRGEQVAWARWGFVAAITVASAAFFPACHSSPPSTDTLAASVASAQAAINSAPKTSDFAILASNSVYAQAQAAVLGGDIAAKATGTGTYLYSGAQVAIDSQAVADNTHNMLGDYVYLGAQSTAGDVQTNHLTAKAQSVHGKVAAFLSPPDMPALQPVQVGTSDLAVAVNATKTISPSQYCAVTLGA